MCATRKSELNNKKTIPKSMTICFSGGATMRFTDTSVHKPLVCFLLQSTGGQAAHNLLQDTAMNIHSH